MTLAQLILSFGGKSRIRQKKMLHYWRHQGEFFATAFVCRITALIKGTNSVLIQWHWVTSVLSWICESANNPVFPSQEVELDYSSGGLGVRGWGKLCLLKHQGQEVLHSVQSLGFKRERRVRVVGSLMLPHILTRNWTNRVTMGI